MKTQDVDSRFADILGRHKIEFFDIVDDPAQGLIVIYTRPKATVALKREFDQLQKEITGRSFKFLELDSEFKFTDKELLPEYHGDIMARLPTKWTTAEEFYKTKGPAMTKEEYINFHEVCCAKLIKITKAKNSDYTGDSADPFANFAQIGTLVQAPNVVEIGFLTRMSDKISRIGSFVTKGTLMVKDESVEDTLLDLANYCILFAGYLKSRKQSEK